MAESAGQRAASEAVAQTIRSTAQLPDYPADCSVAERSGVRHGDRLDAALVKTDQALSRANGRALRCTSWYNRIKEARHGNAY